MFCCPQGSHNITLFFRHSVFVCVYILVKLSLCVYVQVSVCVCLPGVCRCCIMAWSIRESACVTQRITTAWSQTRKRLWEKWQQRSAALIQADMNVIAKISVTCFKALASLLMTFFGFISFLIRKEKTCKHETLLHSNRSWQPQDLLSQGEDLPGPKTPILQL